MDADALRRMIREVPDFPTPGINFYDITTLLSDAPGFAGAVDQMTEPFRDQGIDLVVGIEARGFVLSAPVALALGAGLVPIRKPGKLPGRIDSVTYDLEYGTDTLEIHLDALGAGHRVLIVDDVLATGGAAAAARDLVGRQGAEVVGLAFLLELDFLDGRLRLAGAPVHSVIHV